MTDWRKIKKVVLTVALALTTLGGDALFGQGRQVAASRTAVIDGREVVEGEVIVRYRGQTGQVERQRAEYQVDSDISDAIGRRGARRLRSRQLTTRQMLAMLRANPDVEYAEPNYIIRATATPNDPSMGQLWGLVNSGQVVDGQAGVPGADIGASAAWDLTTGSRATVVAVIDTGIDFSHEDVAANIFTAPRAYSVTIGSTTISCAAGTHGYDATTNTCIPADDNGHGTHVAGIIGAVGNNNIGIAGVNWTANLMALKVLRANGMGNTADAVNAIEFAIKAKAALGADANIRVLNASWGGANFSQALSDEIEAANGADMLFVAAAGSDGTNNDATPHYPSTYASTNVVSVAAVDNTGVLAPYSNYGATSVDLAAPGTAILSTITNNQYGYMTGTSMAAPFVSGAAALMLAVCPSDSATVKSRLMGSVDPDASLSGKTVSGGRLNVGRAVQRCLPALHATLNGTTITASVSNSPGNAADWMGLYCPATSADSTYLDWKYLNGTRTPPATGMTAATVTFQAPSQSGTTCNVRLHWNNQNIKLATSETVTVGAQSSLTIGDVSITEGNSGTSVATFTVTLSPVNASQTVTVNYATADGSATVADNDYVATNGTLNFTPSTATQTINVTVKGDTVVESNETFTVNLSGAINATIGDAQAVGTILTDEAPPGPTITVPSSVTAGSTITFQLANGPGNPRDWLGFYSAAVSQDRGNYQQWQYMDGSQTAPTAGRTGATLTFTAPTTPGTYDIRWFSNDGYTKLATSAGVVVTAGTGPTITAPSSVAPGSTITFQLANGPANARDWVGFYAAGVAEDRGNYQQWQYMNGSPTPPATGRASATLTFIAPTVPGTYNIRWFSNDGYTRLATSGGVVVTGQAPSGPTISAPSTVSAGSTITLQLANGPANARDWVGFYAAGVAEDRGNYQQWQYMNGSQTPPTTGRASATLTFTAPTTPGTYNVRWFANDGYTKLATSTTITVVSAPTADPAVTLQSTTFSPGATIPFQLANGPGNSTDWVGFYVAGQTVDRGNYQQWQYLNGTQTPSSGFTNANLQFTAPQTPGTYNIRWFANGGSTTKLATSVTITVTP